jgi:hypothetical protein
VQEIRSLLVSVLVSEVELKLSINITKP